MSMTTKTTTVLRYQGRNADSAWFTPPLEPGETVRAHRLYLDRAVWGDMGEPHLLTVSIEPGDLLNVGLLDPDAALTPEIVAQLERDASRG